MQTKKGILVGGGPINYPFLRQELAKEYDLLVALDHGARVLDDLGRLPAVVLGDYDSLSPSDQAYFRAQGVRLLSAPDDQDWTDLEIGLEFAAAEGLTELLVFGGLGGRLDHTLANLSLLDKAKRNQTNMFFVGPEQLLTMLAPGEEVVITAFTGGHFSLLPSSAVASGIKVTGARYPLEAATIAWGSTLGVHNEFLGPPVTVSLESGYLLLVIEGLVHWPGGMEIFQ